MHTCIRLKGTMNTLNGEILPEFSLILHKLGLLFVLYAVQSSPSSYIPHAMTATSKLSDESVLLAK